MHLCVNLTSATATSRGIESCGGSYDQTGYDNKFNDDEWIGDWMQFLVVEIEVVPVLGLDNVS